MFIGYLERVLVAVVEDCFRLVCLFRVFGIRSRVYRRGFFFGREGRGGRFFGYRGFWCL